MDQIVVQISDRFKNAIGEYAQRADKTMASVVREALAEKIGYDLSQEPKRSRAPKYETEQEKRDAQALREALNRWGNKTTSRLLAEGDLETAMIIARAVTDRDYETLQALRDASEAIKAEERADAE